MTGKADFTEDQWKAVLEGPPAAGMLVIAASRGGTFRETYAMAKAYTEERKHHGDSQLLDEIAAAKPEIDHKRFHSPEELKAAGLKHLTDALALLQPKATPEEVEQYTAFVLNLAKRVAVAHTEHGEAVSPEEQAAIDEIAQTLG